MEIWTKIHCIMIVLIFLLCLSGCTNEKETATGEDYAVSMASSPDARQAVSGKDYSSIQNEVDSVCEKYGAMGAQVAVVDDGEIVGTYVYGWATDETDPMTAEHKIRVASISKVVVGMATMLLQQEGIVDIDEDIGTYWNTTARNPSYPYTPVTIRSILTHTSSITAYDDESTDYYTILDRLSYGYYDAEPGDIYGYYYNNYAFRVLGATLELAANQRLDDILDEKIFSATGIDASFASGDIDNTDLLVTLYTQYGEVARSVEMQKELHLSGVPGEKADYFAGGLTVSASDLAKLVVLMVSDGVYEGQRLLDEASVAEMEEYMPMSLYDGSYQAKPLFYAENLYGRSGVYFHTGSAYGVYSCFSYDGETKDGIVVLTTGADGTSGQYDIYNICDEINSKIYELIA